MDPRASSESTEDIFEAALGDAIEALPDPFRAQLASVAIVVEEWPTADQLASVHAFGLYGLYQGVPRTAYGAELAPAASKITLFRGPLMRANRSPGALREAVGETLRHEVAHHLGISDARLAELERDRR
ncbi:MAG: metallopeptidase family protein [Chloroflexi bacterium]|nr:metallopeptidase family protein [Chloroflexota bacterium]